jgi:hypothetical protein
MVRKSLITLLLLLGIIVVPSQLLAAPNGPVYPDGMISEEQQDVAEAEARGPVDFRIVDVRSAYGQLIVEVEHFDRYGNFDYYELYTWQGREGDVHARATDTDGRLLLSDGTVAPMAVQFGKLEAYLPAGLAWKRETTPQMTIGSILDVIEKTHIQRSQRGWDKGKERLTLHPLDRNTRDDSGVSKLESKFIGLAGRSYLQPAAEGFNEVDYQGEGGPRDYPAETAWGTTSTFYPSLDGRLDYSDSGGVAWATIRDASSGTDTGYSSATIGLRMRADGNTDEWDYMGRAMVLFDTNLLPDGDSITAATFGLVGSSGDPPSTSFGSSIGLITSTPDSNTALVDADYSEFGTTLQATSINFSSIVANDSTYNDWTLNSTGRGNISLTGITKFGIRVSQDITDSEPSWSAGAKSEAFFHGRNETAGGEIRPRLVVTHASPSAAITGTIGDGATEQEVRDGDGTIIVTLTGTTWVADGATFNAQRQNIIDGLDAADAQTNGWNAEVRDEIGVSSVVRTSGTIATITIAAADVTAYQITTNESITVTVPSTAVASGGVITASPTITITAGTESAAITGTISDGATSPQVQAGDETAIVTLTNTKWVADGATFNAQRQNIIDGFVSASSETNGWNNRRSDFAVTDVERTSDIIVTVTFSASSAYAISAAETITLTVPATAIGGSALTATPTFTITPNYVSSGTWVSPAIDLSSIIDTAYCAVGWSENIPAGTSAAVEYSSNGGSSYSTATNGSCPFTIASSLAAVSDFRIRVTLTTTDTTVTPTITALGFIAGTTAGQTVRYQLNTTPALTATDRTGNGYSGTMSFPALPSGVSTTVGSMTALRAPPSAQTARGIPQVTSPVTGTAVSDNIFNTDETGWTGLPGYQLVNTMATAGDGLPVQFIWYIMLGLVTIMLGFFALNLTQSLFAAGVAMALGLGASIAMGGGLIPGWTIFVFIPVAVGMIFLRPRLAI